MGIGSITNQVIVSISISYFIFAYYSCARIYYNSWSWFVIFFKIASMRNASCFGHFNLKWKVSYKNWLVVSKRVMADVLKPKHPLVCLRFTTFHSYQSITWGKDIWSSFIIWLRSDIPKREPRLWCWVVALLKERKIITLLRTNVFGFKTLLFSIRAKRETRCQIFFRMKKISYLGDVFFLLRK